ncbi:MAG TPA: ABC transporter ATP-binding protein [Hyphomicrobiaceae bacterium]|jgi:iron(III) transport system ATP-binding protein
MADLALEGLSKTYGTSRAVDDVSLRVDHGLLVSLLGPSGCGKTTTLRLIAGFIEPTAGKVRVGDSVVSAPGRVLPPERRNMSMIFQSYALWPHMTVAENVAYGLTLRKLGRTETARKVAGILATTRLSALAERYPSELSGGQQQRVSLARALVVEPETLLLDEPLSNLDANLREEMRFEVRRLHDAYRYTTVYVTHDQSEAMTTSDLVAVMNGGRIEQLGSPREVYDRPVSEFVARFLGGSNILKGTARDASHIEIAGTVLKGGGAPLASGAPAAVSIRQHEIALDDAGAGPKAGMSSLPGKVVRNVFLGAARDYVIALPDETQLRVTAAPDIDLAPGSDVTLRLPEARCRLLSR